MKRVNTRTNNLNLIWILMILLFTMLNISIFSSYSFASSFWYNESFDYRSNINITNDQGIELIDFVTYLNISYDSNMQVDYEDLLFINGSCNQLQDIILDFEIEYYDVNHSDIWVRIPSLKTGVHQICMYFGNSTVSSTQNPTAVWNSNYGMVYHMDSTGQDSTSNNRDRVADIGLPTQNNSYLGYGLTFDGNDAWDLTNIGYYEQEWFERIHEVYFETSSDITTRQTLFSEGGGTNGVILYIVGEQLYARWWSESQGWSGGHINTSVSINTKYHIVMEYDNPGDYTLYVDGILIGNIATTVKMNAHTGDGGIAYTGSNSKDYHDLSGSGNYFQGTLYEFRIFDNIISSEFYNQSYLTTLKHNDTIKYCLSEMYVPNLVLSINSPNTATVYPILQNQSFDYNVTLSCVGKLGSSCYNVSLFSQYNDSIGSFTNISIIDSTPVWTSSINPKFCVLNAGESCNILWSLNMTGLINTEYEIKTLVSSNISEIINLSSVNLTVNIVKGNVVVFNQTNLNFPNIEKNSGIINLSTKVISSIGDNSNIVVSCESGDCSKIFDDFIDGINLLENEESKFNFSCDDSTSGSFSAIFNVTSDEYDNFQRINVNCIINKVYGPININLINPNKAIINNVYQNRTFKINASVICNGECGNITAYAVYDLKQNPFGNGKDGDLIVNSLDTIVNKYTNLVNNENSGDNIITVNVVVDFNIGDEILIIQMQNGSGGGDTGIYEFRKIVNKVGFDLTLDTGLKNNYKSGTFDTTLASVTQIVKVPNYKSVTVNIGASITSQVWDGYDGGIVTFRVQEDLNTFGYINVSEKGFRGGDCNGCGDSAWGDQGEGFLGIGIGQLTANGNGGGGGYGPSGVNGEPGGGGGYGTVGGIGDSTNDAEGGLSVGMNNLSKIFFGGGGGGGGDNDNGLPLPEYSNGAGAIMIFSQKISNARILSNGNDAFGSSGAAGVAGAGAGGTIWLVGKDIAISDVKAIGGASYDDGDDLGGAGGDGRIRLDYVNIVGSTTPVSGFNGDFKNLLNLISEISGTLPFWTVTSQQQSCIILEDGNCSFEWIVNATGPINSTYNVSVFVMSNYSNIETQISENATIKIVNNFIPVITLISPNNNEKILNNGTVEFIWTIDDDSVNLNCSLYIDDVWNQNISCFNFGNNNLSLNLNRGKHNWSISVEDSDYNLIESEVRKFTSIYESEMKLTKNILSINTNQYLIELIYNNTNNFIVNKTQIDYVNNKYNYGSFSDIYNFINLTTGIYDGIILGWNNFIVNPYQSSDINYSIVGVTDYYLKDEFILVID